MDLHWLPVRFRIEFKILLITYKMLHSLAPQYLSQLVSVKSQSRYCLRSSGDGIFLNHPVGCGKAALGNRAFEYSAPHLWNKLPLNVRNAASLGVFKSVLKSEDSSF